MLASFFFVCWRIGQLTTLIPPVGILAWFVDGFVKNNQLTPGYVMVLFIVSVLAAVWALDTLLRHSNAKRSALFISFIDLCFFGAFVAGVYQLRDIATSSCFNFQITSFYVSLGPFGFVGQQSGNLLSVRLNRTCSLLKTAFAFGLMNTMSFFLTAIIAYFMYRHEEKHSKDEKSSRRRSSHSNRRGHSSRHHRSSSDRRRDFEV